MKSKGENMNQNRKQYYKKDRFEKNKGEFQSHFEYEIPYYF